jgi:hypothetical protein
MTVDAEVEVGAVLKLLGEQPRSAHACWPSMEEAIHA